MVPGLLLPSAPGPLSASTCTAHAHKHAGRGGGEQRFPLIWQGSRLLRGGSGLRLRTVSACSLPSLPGP